MPGDISQIVAGGGNENAPSIGTLIDISVVILSDGIVGGFHGEVIALRTKLIHSTDTVL